MIGTPAVGAAITAAGTQQISLPDTTTGCVLVSWAITGAGATFSQAFATLTAKLA